MDGALGGLIDTPLGRAVQKVIADNALVLSRAPAAAGKSGFGSALADGVGKVWNAPNTGLGLAYGLAGHLAGQLNRLRPGDQPDPRIQLGHNAVEFVDNPLGGVGAITLGNSTTYSGDPYDPKDKAWYHDGRDPRIAEHGHSYMDHEEQHTIQGQQLGPFYLPSNLAGGIMGLLFDRDETGGRDWHGPHNWNETGPQGRVSRPWPKRKP